MTMTDQKTPQVYADISAVQKALCEQGISKDRKNQAQGYQFRGIDDVYNALSPILAKVGLCVLPRMLTRACSEHPSKNGGVLFYVTVEAEFDLVSATDGSKHVIRTFGEAMDSGDKATNKAMSAAYKYACMQAFAIPTEGDNDADSRTHAPGAKVASKTGEILKKKPTWLPDQSKEIGSIFAEIYRLGAAAGEAEVSKLRNEMAYDAPSDVIDSASKILNKWRDIAEVSP